MQLKLTIGIYLSDTWLQFFMNTIADVSALEYAHIQIRLNCFDFGMVLHGLTAPPQHTEKHRKQSHKWAQVVWSSDQKCDLFYKVGLVICHFEDQHAFVGFLGILIVNLCGNCRTFVNTVQYLVCRTLLCETQTDRKVQTIFGPQGGALNPSGILVFWKDKWHCSKEDQASEHWKAIWKTKGLQICNQDPRLSQKQYFVATHPYEQRGTMMKHVLVNGCDQLNRT